MTHEEVCKILKVGTNQVHIYVQQGKIRVLPVRNGARSRDYNYNTEDVMDLARCRFGPCTIPYFYVNKQETSEEEIQERQQQMIFFCRQVGYKGVRAPVYDSVNYDSAYPPINRLLAFYRVLHSAITPVVERIVLWSTKLFPSGLSFDLFIYLLKAHSVEVVVMDKTKNPRKPYIL